MKKIIIGIVGENASGKTTLTNYLINTYGAQSFRFSDMLTDMLKRIYLPNTREHLQTMSTVIRQHFGEDVMSKTLAADMSNANARIVVTEGIRRPSDITYLSQLEGFHLVSLETDMNVRYERLKGRNEKPDDASKTWEAFQTEATHESEQKIAEIAAQAEFRLDNNGTIEELYIQVDEMIKTFE